MRSLNQRMTYEQPPAATGDKIGMIEGSMRCYVCGLIGLVPVLGIPGSILALIWGARARRAAQQQWTPADLYLALGHAAAIAGLLLSALALAALLAVLAHEAFPESWSGWWG